MVVGGRSRKHLIPTPLARKGKGPFLGGRRAGMRRRKEKKRKGGERDEAVRK